MRQKVLTVLADTTSRRPMTTAQIRASVGTGRLVDALKQLEKEHLVMSCIITKNQTTVKWWWRTGNITPFSYRTSIK